jgi:hypothetical protein
MDQAVSSGSSEAGSPLDNHMQLEFAIEEDIPAELEDFVRLSRLGMFKDAEELFEQTLKDHVNLFPVAAEYADFLLEQGRYGRLQEFVLEFEGETWERDEVDLFVLLSAFSGIRISGQLTEALSLARRWRTNHSKSPEQFTEAEIQSLETCLHIIVLVDNTSTALWEADTQPPWIISDSILPWGGYEEWCISLSRNNRPWESQRILRLLLNVIPPTSATYLVERFIESNNETNSPVALALLSGINAYVARLLDESDDYHLPEVRLLRLRARELDFMVGNRERAEGLSRMHLENRLHYIRTSLFDAEGNVSHATAFRLDEIAFCAETQKDYLILREALRLLIIARLQIHLRSILPPQTAHVSQFQPQKPQAAPPVETLEELLQKLEHLNLVVMKDHFGSTEMMIQRREQWKICSPQAGVAVPSYMEHLPARIFSDKEQEVASDSKSIEEAQPQTRRSSTSTSGSVAPSVFTSASRSIFTSTSGFSSNDRKPKVINFNTGGKIEDTRRPRAFDKDKKWR